MRAARCALYHNQCPDVRCGIMQTESGVWACKSAQRAKSELRLPLSGWLGLAL
jgi:hypothetical protein